MMIFIILLIFVVAVINLWIMRGALRKMTEIIQENEDDLRMLEDMVNDLMGKEEVKDPYRTKDHTDNGKKNLNLNE